MDKSSGDADLAPVEVAGLAPVEQRMFDAISRALAERRLAPGAKLVEEQLSDIFGISRARVRRVLLVLSQRHVVTLEHNRGAFVSRPSARNARELYEARYLLELEVVRRVATASQAERTRIAAALREHIARETEALDTGDRAAQVRLSGDFHAILATACGNEVLATILRDLIARMNLALAANIPFVDLDCSLREHTPIVAAIAVGDVEQAVALSRAHMEHVEEMLARSDDTVGVNLAQIFAGDSAAARAKPVHAAPNRPASGTRHNAHATRA